jgi:ABC-type antimicrobial peptide transport system permease subunit
MFLPFTQFPQRRMTLVIRAAGDPLGLVPAVRSEVQRLDAELPLSNIGTMSDRLAQSVALPRLFFSLFTFFAIVALSLAAIGIYGVTSFAVQQRRQEIGVRMALGAQESDVVRLILKHAALLASAGLAIGLVAAYALSRSIAGMLFELSPTDPVTYAAIVIVLAGVAMMASWLPARRATRVDPLTTLRTE